MKRALIFFASLFLLIFFAISVGRATNPTRRTSRPPLISSPRSTSLNHLKRSPSYSSAGSKNVELVGHIGGVTKAIFVKGNYAYIGVGPRLTILDISHPASPTVVGKTAPMPDIVEDI